MTKAILFFAGAVCLLASQSQSFAMGKAPIKGDVQVLTCQIEGTEGTRGGVERIPARKYKGHEGGFVAVRGDTRFVAEVLNGKVSYMRIENSSSGYSVESKDQSRRNSIAMFIYKAYVNFYCEASVE